MKTFIFPVFCSHDNLKTAEKKNLKGMEKLKGRNVGIRISLWSPEKVYYRKFQLIALTEDERRITKAIVFVFSCFLVSKPCLLKMKLWFSCVTWP